MPGANRAALSDGDLTVAAGNCEKPSAALAPFLYRTDHSQNRSAAGGSDVRAGSQITFDVAWRAAASNRVGGRRDVDRHRLGRQVGCPQGSSQSRATGRSIPE